MGRACIACAWANVFVHCISKMLCRLRVPPPPPDWTNEFSYCNLSRVTVVLSAKQERTERKEVPWVEGSWLYYLKLLILHRVADCSVSAPGPWRSKRHRWNARAAWRKGTNISVNNLETKHDTLTKERTLLLFIQRTDHAEVLLVNVC